MTVLFYDHDDACLAPLATRLCNLLAEARELDVEAHSAGRRPSHVRSEVRKVLSEVGAATQGLVAKPLLAAPLDEITHVITLCPDLPAVLPHAQHLAWHLPDPSSAPPAERLDAFRTARDELLRRLRLFLIP